MNAQNQATVIIPGCNVGEYIEECLESVKVQGASVHHTYAVDNNSFDDTVTKVKEWQKKHPNLSLTLRHEKKPGAPVARNNPLQLVETKWIQFLYAYDLLLPNLKLLLLTPPNPAIGQPAALYPERVISTFVAHQEVLKCLSAAVHGILWREPSTANKVAAPKKLSKYLQAGLNILSNEAAAVNRIIQK